MKTRIVEYRDGNGKSHYRPQFKWWGIWMRYSDDIFEDFDSYNEAEGALLKVLYRNRGRERKVVKYIERREKPN